MKYSTSNFEKSQAIETLIKIYRSATFTTSAAKITQLPLDEGHEIAIVGRSNAGKSTFLNILTGQKSLAKISKTPGRTQLMNVFDLAIEGRRIVDLPGYGFAKVSQSMKFDWEKHLGDYLVYRESLKGVVVLMDIRHPLQDLDKMMLGALIRQQLPVHILLTKADKISKSTGLQTLRQVQNQLAELGLSHCVQTFSIQQKETLFQVVAVLNEWLAI
ncbi:MAG: YihA family ribosome biogenesis GTP-binding protein [Gammaproteobacteria bacterium]|nr:YihA family ribosome biogenesis GTP-binding protein [Gammaproteobacteria bacterium]